jgi:hypothetical protein
LSGPLLSGVRFARRFQEPPEVFALRAVSVFVSLPAGKARLRRRFVVVSESGYRRGVVAMKRGIVYVDVEWHRRDRLGYDIVPGEPPVWGTWEPDDPARPEDAGERRAFDDAEAAIAWAREHAPLVLVRVGRSEGDIYSAGERRATRDLPEYGGTDLRPYPEWSPGN